MAIEDAALFVLDSIAAFAADMRRQGIHVGMGSPGHCVACGDVWPCEASTEKGAE